ncbi:MAG: PD40 domain-containing protein [Marinilabiliaceae bacterium]|nr:PD40 domain-containing protein [Marinilabiliaceae bacterium]
MKYRIFYILTIVTIVIFCSSSCKSRSAVAGIEAYNIGEYSRAEKILLRHAKTEENKYKKAEYNFYLGECYRHMGLYTRASNAYKQAVKNNYDNPIALLYMGDCQRQIGRLDDAAEAYELYLRRIANDRQAKNGQLSCELEKKSLDILMPKNQNNKAMQDTGYQLKPVKSFNSKFSDYSPAYVGDDYEVVYFTSMRTAKRRRKMNRITGQGNSTIYVSKLNGGEEWTEPEPLPEPWSSKIDDGTPNLSSDGKTMFFTRCPYDDNAQSATTTGEILTGNTAQAFEVSRSGGRWGEPKRIIPGGDSTIMVAHPAISPDGTTLYFVSDMKGSVGGKDIWFSHRDGDGWGKPENAGGIINTAGDEMFPYVRDNGVLYFSSNGHVGYGGLDIFVATPTETGLVEVRNMGLPINSMGDDFGIVFQGNKEKGLLSSNRGNNKGIDNIYSFNLPDVVLTLEGSISDASKRIPDKAFIRIIGSDGTNSKLKPNEDGLFGLNLEKETDYIMLCGAKGYENQRFEFSTRGKSKTEKIPVKVTLKKRD